jgi:hypothetical protein
MPLLTNELNNICRCGMHAPITWFLVPPCRPDENRPEHLAVQTTSLGNLLFKEANA